MVGHDPPLRRLVRAVLPPERFEVAAFGLVLFTALFALGMAPQGAGGRPGRRLRAWPARACACWRAARTGPRRCSCWRWPSRAAALRAAARRHAALALVAAVAIGLPFLAWCARALPPRCVRHRRGLGGRRRAAARRPRRAGAGPRPAPLERWWCWLGGGAGRRSALRHATDRPLALLAASWPRRPGCPCWSAGAGHGRRRRAWRRRAGRAAPGWTAFFGAGARPRTRTLIALPVAGAYLLSLLVRGLLARAPARARGRRRPPRSRRCLAWTVLYRVLYRRSPQRSGLGLGRRWPRSTSPSASPPPATRAATTRQARVLLGLAASFLTLAIPVQLGLHGITLAWAVEASLLLALGGASSPRSPGSAATACWAWPSCGSSPATCRCTRAVPSRLQPGLRHVAVRDPRPGRGPAASTREAAAPRRRPSIARCGRWWPRWPSLLLFCAAHRRDQRHFAQQAAASPSRAATAGRRRRTPRRRPGGLRAVDGVRHRPAGRRPRRCATARCSTRLTRCSRSPRARSCSGTWQTLLDSVPHARRSSPSALLLHGGRVPEPALPRAADAARSAP